LRLQPAQYAVAGESEYGFEALWKDELWAEFKTLPAAFKKQIAATVNDGRPIRKADLGYVFSLFWATRNYDEAESYGDVVTVDESQLRYFFSFMDPVAGKGALVFVMPSETVQAPPSAFKIVEEPPRRRAKLELARVRFSTKAAEVLAKKQAQRVQVQLEELVPRMMAGALRVGLPWETVVLNDKREQAVITPTVVGQWLHALGLSEEGRSMTWQAATTPQALDALATALISEKMADTANIAHLGDQNILVVTRRRK
jgi:hypothetical protein